VYFVLAFGAKFDGLEKGSKKKEDILIKSLLITEKRVASDKISKDFCEGFRLDNCKGNVAFVFVASKCHYFVSFSSPSSEARFCR
jgi:hypothetical protein